MTVEDFDPSVTVGTSVGFTREEVERFDILIMFKQIELMLGKYYEPDQVQQIYESMVKAQDKLKMAGINRHDDDLFKKEYMKYCSKCGIDTFHHKISYGSECAVCQNIINRKGR